MRRPTDIAAMIGKRYNRLIVLADAGINPSKYKIVLCRCDCGTEKTIEAGRVQKGKTKSCGCLQHDIAMVKYRKRNIAAKRANPLDAIDEDIIG